MTLWLYAILPPAMTEGAEGAENAAPGAGNPATPDTSRPAAGASVGGSLAARRSVASPTVRAGAESKALGTGVAGEPLELVPCAGLRVAVGRIQAAPAVGETALRAHDAVVRRLQAASTALLPVRFGQTVPDESALSDLLSPRRAAFVEALATVAGCRQMTLRVLAPVSPAAAAPASNVSAETPAAPFGADRPSSNVAAHLDVSAETSLAASGAGRRSSDLSARPDVSAETSPTGAGAARSPLGVSATSDVSAETSAAAGPPFDVSASPDVSAETFPAAGSERRAPEAGSPGTRYLAERRVAARRRRSLPEIAPVLAELAPLVRAERIERGGPPPLVGSAYHLVPEGRAGEWIARLESAAPSLTVEGSRLAWSGPFPPWAFAPELA